MKEALQLIGFGSIAIDDIVYVDQSLPLGKGKVIKRVSAHGGNIATALVAAARLGARAGFVGWLNTDIDADQSAADLSANHVDISYAPRHKDAHPIRSTITVGADGDRFIAYDDDVMIGTSQNLADDILHNATVLLVDSYAVSSLSVVERAVKYGVAVVGDIEWSRGAQTDRLLALCDHLVLPLGYARQLTGLHDTHEILSALWAETRSALILTDGAEGSFLRQKGDARLWHLPAFDVHVVDTTGAGDCYHGGYAYGLIKGYEPLRSAMLAGAAASLSVTALGGRAALPELTSVLSLMENANVEPRKHEVADWE